MRNEEAPLRQDKRQPTETKTTKPAMGPKRCVISTLELCSNCNAREINAREVVCFFGDSF